MPHYYFNPRIAPIKGFTHNVHFQFFKRNETDINAPQFRKYLVFVLNNNIILDGIKTKRGSELGMAPQIIRRRPFLIKLSFTLNPMFMQIAPRLFKLLETNIGFRITLTIRVRSYYAQTYKSLEIDKNNI